MIYGIGTDIVKIDRVKDLIDKYESKFLKRILSERELDVMVWNRRYEFSAARFASKEALYKAMGRNYNIDFTDISILNDDNKKPYVYEVNLLKEKLGLKKNEELNVNLSISHEKEFAVAFVVLEII